MEPLAPAAAEPPDDGSQVAIIKAQMEAARQKSAMLLSGLVTVIMLSAHIAFEAHHEHLVLPDLAQQIVWGIIFAPWLGATGAKFADWLAKKLPS